MIKIGIIAFLLLIPLAAMGATVLWHEKNIGCDAALLGPDGREKNSSQAVKNDIVQFSFTGSVDKDSVENNLRLIPGLENEVSWQDGKTLELELKEHLNPDSEYRAELSGFKSKLGVPLEKSKIIRLSSPPPPEKLSFFPADGQENIDYKENAAIVLDRPLPESYYLQFDIDPYVKIDYRLEEERKKIIFDPQKELFANTEYEVAVDLKHKKYEDFSRRLHHGFFTTKKPAPIIYSFDKEGNPFKTEERTILPEPRITRGKYIDIDLSEQVLSIFQDGKELGAYKASTGMPGMETPTGEFEVMGKASRPWSKDYELFMPWFIQFTSDGHGIHELPEWPGGVKEGVHHLGFPVSHGCVRLGVGPAKKVYDFSDIGTPIVIHY
ncbi:MAG: L,D-transpeptidase [Candidatus Moranbacteria bacterium]|nr:L,D-transpeptidase [Candidatus Moranbacteria bacterium]